MTDRSTFRRLTGWVIVPILLLGAIGAWLVFDPGFRTARQPTAGVAELPQDAFEQRVRAYLLEHPEVIVESMQRLESRRREAEKSEALTILRSRANEVFRDAASPVGGNPNGDVTLVEFFDYNCPYCRQVAPVVQEAAAADAQLRIVYKEFPILGPNSMIAAKAALAVHRQGKYVVFHEALMQGRGTVDEGRVLDAAAKVGAEVERMKSDMTDPEIEAAIERNLALAQALRINGTPGFVIGDQILRGATDLKTLQSLIREARQQSRVK